MSNYFKSLKLGLNASKTKIMFFDKGYQRNSISSIPKITLNKESIDVVSSFKYLGTWIDNKLKINVHLDACIRNANHKSHMLRIIRNCLDFKTANLVHKTMVLPVIEYGNCFLLGCTLAEKTKIQRIQNKGLKIAASR